ncbi:LysR family transcriptional regulator [Falsirhodobacter deserti]|uniref:LysR family transcriptional regulator n=1 Tax=Falsirhodobacter deserti TaxID=1365611 RepID=UPI0013E2F632|nr:LysR family transcriptional regulator [Falsirhodobacter deserti]
MDRLEALSIFVAAVDGGSLAAAGRKLGCSSAKVTRAVAQTEAMVGERLLERTTRRFAATEAGIRHVESFRRILDEFESLRPRSRATVSGMITVTAPELFGRLHVLHAIRSFQKAYPEVRVRLLLLNRVVDLVSEGLDVAVRLAALPDSSLSAVKVGTVRRLTCAAPSYLAGRPRPTRPADLGDHWCIGLNEAGAQELWQYRHPIAPHRLRSVRVTCRLSTTSAATAIAAAEEGEGVIRPLSYQVQRQLAEGTLETLLDRHEPEPLPVHLVFRPRLGSAARAFVDHVVPLLRRSI